MASPAEALQVLERAVRVAQSKGAYGLEDAEAILTALSTLNSIKDRLSRSEVSEEQVDVLMTDPVDKGKSPA